MCHDVGELPAGGNPCGKRTHHRLASSNRRPVGGETGVVQFALAAELVVTFRHTHRANIDPRCVGTAR